MPRDEDETFVIVARQLWLFVHFPSHNLPIPFEFGARRHRGRRHRCNRPRPVSLVHIVELHRVVHWDLPKQAFPF